ncbi:MAG TPA: acetyl-CoA carboxylase biotin carboxyl carrier protein [Gemmatimonadales bacterium]|nr:acetyl-CoA carboxylase biotin carboxyl carrier protein [Gemmatimonadales bacterium]
MARGSAARSQAAVTELARQLATLLKELDLTEIEASIGELRVRLQRGRTAAPLPAAPGTPTEIVSVPTPVVDSTAAVKLITIEAPMVGTFYRASSPTAEPYVREGDVVKEGQILCIIEAMKLMNEIESRASGRIVKILVENGQPVEYGQPLVLIDPTG